MAEAKAQKWEFLDFMEDREIVTAYDLMQKFGYTYSYAHKKLSLLKKQGLVLDLGDTPSTNRGQWCLTEKGYARLNYLCRKLGVLSERQKKEWREWLAEENNKPLMERRVWWVDGEKWRLVREGEYGVTLEEAKEAMRLSRR